MADQKISQLTGATTPLAGTEVLPIVQSSTTKKVSVANLTAGRDVSMDNATINGHANVLGGDVRFDAERLVYSYAGGTVGQYRSGTYYDGSGLKQVIYLNNAEVGRWTGTDLQIKSGNFVPSTAAKGVNFTANTPAAGMTSQLLNWYEEGTFTPQVADAASGGNTATFSGGAAYTRIGRQVTLYFYADNIDTTGMTAGNAVYFRNFPFTSSSNNKSMGAFYSYRVGGGSGQSASVLMGSSVTYARIFIYTGNSATADTILKVSDLVSGTSSIYFSLTYFV